MLFGSFHLILFVSSTNYFKIVRRQCCLLEDFKSHLDSFTVGGLVVVVVMLMTIVMEMLMTKIRMIMIIISTHSCWSHGYGGSGPAM